MKHLFISCLVVMLLFANARADEEQDKKEKSPRLTVAVQLSVEDYDPDKPAGTLTCVVHNHSTEAIRLPAEYDGRTIIIYGVGKTHRGHSNLWRPNRKTGEKQRLVTIEPGKKAAVFEASLKAILTPHTDEAKEREWAWDWRYRHEPPQTPIQGWRRDGLEERATFFAELRMGEEKFKSEAVNLAVTKGKADKQQAK